MKKFKVLILTDHQNHSAENSLYPLAKAMRHHPKCEWVEVASRGVELNRLFFKGLISNALQVKRVEENFNFHENGLAFKKNLRREFLRNYDVIWLRMPPPLSPSFLHFLQKTFQHQIVINDPKGIHETGSKAFLLNFPNLCPPMQICDSLEQIVAFKNRFPIVLKPLRDYGGKGILRIDGEDVWEGTKKLTFTQLANRLQGESFEYLGVKFLKNVSEGDKRIVVVNGEIMGASLRKPAKGSWICNVAMGGTASKVDIQPEEIEIIQTINPMLIKMGIVMYGIDTLVGDDGRRVLSEINTTSIGGLPQMAAMTGQPLVKKAISLIWDFIIKKMEIRDAVTN